MNTKRAPKVRFKGFTDAWELRKFGDMADYKKGPFGSALKKEIFIPKSDDSVKVYEQQNAINKNWKLERYFITKSYAKKLNAFETHSGDILISCAGTIGEMYELPDESEPGIINQALMRVRVNEKVVSKKLYKLLFNHMIEDFSKEYSNGSAIKNIPPFADLKPMTAMVPSMEEQFQLSGFFANLDNLITLHQRKLDKMKELKKAFLNLIFSQKLRFRGFTESWELRKLKDITYPAGEKNRENLPLDSYSITNEHGFIPQDERFENGGTMREADKKMYYIVSPHSFAYNPARINIGSIGYQNTDKNVIVSSLYEVFKTSDDVDDRLLWYWFKSSYFQKLIEQFQEGGVRLYFYYDKLCMGTLSLPSFEEQHKIGKYLDTYDNLITLRQGKINQLTKLKTTFLKNMFL